MLCTWQNIQFSTLMMFTGQRPVNIGHLAGDTTRAYVAMAVGLAQTLQAAHKSLRVYTNDPERLLALAGEKAHLLQPAFMDFDPAFPKTIRFYAAHHKLHIFERFGEEETPNCFLDLDIVLTKGADQVSQLLEQPRAMEAWVYDISGQHFPTYSRQVVQGALIKLGATNSFPRWYGGEFIMGVPAFFARLSSECKRILPTYLSVWESLHHVSDEPVTSTALATVINEFAVGDAGDSGLVMRYWSSRTRHPQPPYTALSTSAFWHLPDMKWAMSRNTLFSTSARLARAIRARQFVMAARPLRR